MWSTVCYTLLITTIFQNYGALGIGRHGKSNKRSMYESDASITIGLISDKNAEKFQAIFEYAIEQVNKDLSVPLVAAKEVIAYGDSLSAFNCLCQMMQNGVGAIFGPSSMQASAHLSTICDAKDVPYIHSQVNLEADSLNLHPQPMDMAIALNSIITAFDWTHFIFLYESSEYLPILDGLTSLYVSDGPIINVHRYDLHLNGNYKPVLRRVRKSALSRIVVVGSTESVGELLKQAQQIGIINEEYNYIIGNLDFHTFNLEDYKYSEANITSLRLFSPEKEEVQQLIEIINSIENGEGDEEREENEDEEQDEKEENEEGEEEEGGEEEEDETIGSCPITLEMALIYDAVMVLGESSKYLKYQPQSLNCSEKNDNVQEHGSTLRNYMRSVDISEKTISGRIYFDEAVRKGYTFDVIELQQSGVVKVGTWDELNDLIIDRPPVIVDHSDIDENSLVNKTFRVLLSVGNQPYASLIDSEFKLDGNNQFEGYLVDLIKELANILGFNFTLMDGGKDYGSFNKSTNVTTGMLKEIVEGRADLAMADLTITAEREEVVDFSTPFMNLGISVLYIKPQKAPPDLFSFMDPFSPGVWYYLGLAFVGVTLSFYILGRLSPSEWDNPYPCCSNADQLENQFTLNNSMWFTTGALLQQGSEIAPKSLSTRTVASIWWFFILIIVSSYTANLAAFLTIEKPTGLIESVQDLANSGRVNYGCRKKGATRTFFLTTENTIYKKMNQYMLDNPDMLTEDNQEGVRRVQATYAFLMESTTIEYNTVRQCNMMKLGEPLDEKGYGIAMPKNWPYRDKFNNALLELQEQGVLAALKNKWWNEVGAGVCDKSSDDGGDASPLNMENLGGVYYVLLFGSLFSTIYAIILWLLHVYRKSKKFEVTFKAALMEEAKIVLDFGNNEVVVKNNQSVYSRSHNSSLSIGSMANENHHDDDDEDRNTDDEEEIEHNNKDDN